MRRKPGALIPLEVAILTVAHRLDREFHGYELARELASGDGQRALTAYGTLYRALGRLETLRLLTSHWEDPAVPAREKRPGRRLYTLTAAGLKALRAAEDALRHSRSAARRAKWAPA